MRIVRAIVAASERVDAARRDEGGVPVDPLIDALLTEACVGTVTVTRGPPNGIDIATDALAVQVATSRLGGPYVVRTMCARIAMRWALDTGCAPPVYGGRVVLHAGDGRAIDVDTANQPGTGYWIRMWPA